MFKLLIDTSPLLNGHSHRGVGQYTRLLTQELEKNPDLAVFRSDRFSATPCEADIIHYPFFDLFSPSLPLWKKAKTVVTIHDVIPLKFLDYYSAGKRGMLSLWRQKMALKSVSAVITDSLASAADIIKFLHVASEKVTVIPLAANPLLQPAELSIQRRVRNKYHLPDKFLLYVGDINYNKNLPQLIKMLKFLPDEIHLVCMGKNFYPHDIPEWRWIESQLALSNVTDRVQFITNLDTTEIELQAALYGACSVYVQPSLAEGFGLPVIEALQCGAPVVASKIPALLEIGGPNAVFANPDAEALAEAVKIVLLWSTSTRKNAIAAGKKWANNFSWSKTATETAAVYQKVLHQP